MSEVIVYLDHAIVDQSGRTFYVNVAAESTVDDRWEAWLEFVPLDDSTPLVTDTQTFQPTRGDVERWAQTLTETYVRNAFTRTAAAEAVRVSRIATRVHDPAVLAATATLDPFELLLVGKAALRARLLPLSRAELLTIIAQHNLNPAGVSLAQLSASQLVTFIVTATEAQVLLKRGQ